MIIISLDSLAVCLLMGIIMCILLIFLSCFKSIPTILLGLLVVISSILIITPLIILDKSSYSYPRMGYGYFAHVNNALRFTHALDKPLDIENFTNIINKKPPNMIILSINNQIEFSDYILKPLLKPLLPRLLDLDEHRYANNYEPNTCLSKKRFELNKSFHKHYSIDSKIINLTDKYNNIFNKGVIGTHIRFSGFYINKKNDFNKQIKAYTDYIDKSKYHYVYLATHLKDVEDIFRNKYGSRLIINEHYRNPNKNSDWTSNNLKQEEEDTNVLVDMILLSKCKEIVGGPSNVFYAALWYNPELKFHIPDILKDVVCG